MAKRTKAGNVKESARDKHATLSGGRFPIWDKRSAVAALRLRGHGTTESERKRIIQRAAKYAPQAAQAAAQADSRSKKSDTKE